MTAPHEKWLLKAADDLSFAKVGIEGGFYAQVCFLAQQATEKSLKAYLIYKERSYPKTHKLVELWRECSEIAAILSPLSDQLKIVDGYYMPARYPDSTPTGSQGEPGKANAVEALEIAKGVYGIIEKHVSDRGSTK